ncbi:hypothetical protein EDB89DRAFT_1930849 [Lactarius sanguifluus]|nr:hypothetical protein EDB89DRAFT_1930849 [Lactarius sanguifluus]
MRTISSPHSSNLIVLVLSASPSQARSSKSYPQSRSHFRNWKKSFFCLETVCGRLCPAPFGGAHAFVVSTRLGSHSLHFFTFFILPRIL